MLSPPMLSPLLTGRVDRGSCGLVFDYLKEVEPERSFNPMEWETVFKKSSQSGVWCAIRRGKVREEGRVRYIVAVARICKPFAVWFKGEYGS
jgi:hypothetical protein